MEKKKTPGMTSLFKVTSYSKILWLFYLYCIKNNLPFAIALLGSKNKYFRLKTLKLFSCNLFPVQGNNWCLREHVQKTLNMHDFRRS